MLSPKYEVDMTIQYWVIALFILTRYVTLWPWPSTFRPWNHVTLCHLGVHKPCTKFELDKTYRSRVRTIRICHWFRVSPNLYAFFCRIKGSNFKFYLFCPPKGTTLDRTTHNKQENVSKGAICGRAEETKKGKKLSCRNHASNWLFAQTTNVDLATWNFACGSSTDYWK